MFKLTPLFFLTCFLVACGQQGAKVADCSSPEVAQQVTSFVAGEIIGDGADAERAPELMKRLTVTEVKNASQPQTPGTLRCNAQIAIAFPPEFSGKILSIFTTPALIDGLKDHLNIKYGAFYGPATYRQLSKLFTAGINQAEVKTMSPEQVDSIVNKTLQKNIETVLNYNNKIDVTYTITSGEASSDKSAVSVKSQINDIENYEQNVLVLKLLGNLQ
jgi:hypothetical protein